ncbi:MAG TPA: VOC family protein [Nitrolancea sp.]|nr:VOC family protein [Nitrolancea sp.]
MNAKRSKAVMPVTNLTASLAFYRDCLGFTVIEHNAASDLAWIDANGYPLLLAGPDAGDIASNPDEILEVVRPNGTLHVFANDLDRLRAELTERGVTSVRLVERAWGDRTLTIRDPDGFTVSFWTLIQRPPEQVLALYETGPAALDAALTGLNEPDLDLACSPESWTIRQTVHHLADLEAATFGQINMAFAEPGRIYHGNPFSSDTWSVSLDYAGRPIGSSVQLFRAIREHIAHMARHLPDAWERSSRNSDGQERPISLTLSMLSSHALEHIEEIREARRIYGR